MNTLPPQQGRETARTSCVRRPPHYTNIIPHSAVLISPVTLLLAPCGAAVRPVSYVSTGQALLVCPNSQLLTFFSGWMVELSDYVTVVFTLFEVISMNII
jgi:hypothetical protein